MKLAKLKAFASMANDTIKAFNEGSASQLKLMTEFNERMDEAEKEIENASTDAELAQSVESIKKSLRDSTELMNNVKGSQGALVVGVRLAQTGSKFMKQLSVLEVGQSIADAFTGSGPGSLDDKDSIESMIIDCIVDGSLSLERDHSNIGVLVLGDHEVLISRNGGVCVGKSSEEDLVLLSDAIFFELKNYLDSKGIEFFHC